MAAQVLEMSGGGFDLDDVEAVDLDAAPPPPAEGVKAVSYTHLTLPTKA